MCRLTWCISSTGGSVNFDPTGCLRTWGTRRSSLEDTAQRNWWFRGSLWVYLTLWYYPRLHLRASLYTGYPSDSLCQLPEKWEDGYIIVGVHSSELKSHISHYMWSQLLIGTFIIYVGDGGAYVVCSRLVWPIRSVGIITATFFQKLSSVIYSQFHHVRRSYTRPCWVFRLTFSTDLEWEEKLVFLKRSSEGVPGEGRTEFATKSEVRKRKLYIVCVYSIST